MVKFGWRVPDFPMDGSNAVTFRDQQFAFLDAFQTDLDSAWVADHFLPWMGTWDQHRAARRSNLRAVADASVASSRP